MRETVQAVGNHTHAHTECTVTENAHRAVAFVSVDKTLLEDRGVRRGERLGQGKGDGQGD